MVVVDKDVERARRREVAWIVGTHMDPLRDVQMTQGPVDDLDDAAESAGIRREDGHRRDAEMGVRGLHAQVARTDQNSRGGCACGQQTSGGV